MDEEKDKGSLTKSTSFLGKGWGFPPEFLIPPESLLPPEILLPPKNKPEMIVMTADEEDIRKSLEILLSTRPGERVMRPDFGCDLSSLSFELITSSLKSFIKDLIKTSILYHESRITVEDVILNADQAQEGKINITIDYTIRNTNSRSNYVYPFYKTEATAIL